MTQSILVDVKHFYRGTCCSLIFGAEDGGGKLLRNFGAIYLITCER